MTDEQQESLQLAHAYFDAKERRDYDATVALLADDIIFRHPLNASGDPSPWNVFNGKKETSDYQKAVIERFSQLKMLDQEYHVTSDARTVFVTARGDYLQVEDGRSYTNVYVFKFVCENGKIIAIDEYANPVTYAKLAGLPIGEESNWSV